MLTRAPVLLWLAGIVLAVLVILHTPFAADMSAFLPRSAKPSQQILVDQLREGVASRLFLVAVERAPTDMLATLSKSMADALRSQEGIVLVSNGDVAALGRDKDYVWRNRYLLSADVTPERFTVDGLRAALQNDIALLGSQLGMMVKQSLPHDPTGEILSLADILTGDARPAMRDGVWFSPDFARAILMVQSAAAGFDLDSQEQVAGKIRTAFEAARNSLPQASAATLTLTGPPIFAIHSRTQIQGDATHFSMLATALVALVLLLAYRSPRVLFLSLIPVASGALAGIALVGLVFGSVHGITLGFGVALIGEAVDYSVYLFSRVSPQSAPRATVIRLWPTLRLGLLTSLVGFSAMLMSSFIGFVQLGLFVMTGLSVAALVMRFVLPQFLPAGFSGVRVTRLGTAALRGLSYVTIARPAIAFVVAAAAMTLVLHRGPFWEDELQSMNPVPRIDQQQDHDLRRDMGAPDVRYIVMASAKDSDSALALSEKLDAPLRALIENEKLSGFDAPYFYLPSLQTQHARQNAIPDRAQLEANLVAASTGLPFKPDLFTPFLEDAAAARVQPLLTRASLDGTALALKLDALLLKRKDGVVAMLPLRGVSDADGITTALSVLNLPDVLVLDLKDESDHLLASYLREAQILALLGSLAIVVLLAIALRSFGRVKAALLPLGGAVIVTTALLTLAGQQLSIFNLFGLLLVVAIGSNYTLFFESEDLTDEDGPRVMTSLVLANLCTVLAFGILSFSQIPVMHGIGLTVAIGTALSLIFGAILTPHRRGARA